MTYVVTIPGWRPTPDNKIAGGTHWATRKRLKDADAEMVAAYCTLADVPRATGKRRVQLQVVLVGRQKETDPLAYAKSLLDALVKCGRLVDDTSEYVEWVPPAYKRGAEASCTILLTEVCDA